MATRPGATRSLFVAALALAALALPAAWHATGQRFTSVDVLAREVGERARPRDRVVLIPSSLAPSFGRYYEGGAPWTALPPLADTRVNRTDQVARAMASPDPIGGVLREVEDTLDRNGRVFLVRTIRPLPPTSHPLVLPQPARPGRANARSYQTSWSQQLDASVVRSDLWVKTLAVPGLHDVSPLEAPLLQVVEKRPRQ